MIQEELLGLYMNLLKKSAEDHYRGHEDYELILDKIDPDIPMVGSTVSIQKRDPRTGQIYTVNYKLHVHDDLGNRITCLDDLGGKCTKGELAHNDYIFDCIKCHRKFCLKHVQFVDNDRRRPLCNYGGGLFGKKGCFYKYEHEFSIGLKKLTKYDKEIAKLEAQTAYEDAALMRDEARLRREETALKREELRRKRKNLSEKKSKGSIITFSSPGTGSFDVKCPNCDFSPWNGHNINCSSCGSSWKSKNGVNCPGCGSRASSISCHRCSTQMSV